MSAYLPAILSLVGAVIGASLSYWLAIRRFRSERWWERKYQAYSDVLEALNDMRARLDTFYDAYIEKREVPKQEAQSLLTAYRDGMRNIEKQRAIGGLVLGDKVVDELRKFEQAMAKASGGGDQFEYLDGSLGAVNECISKVISLGREHLYAKR